MTEDTPQWRHDQRTIPRTSRDRTRQRTEAATAEELPVLARGLPADPALACRPCLRDDRAQGAHAAWGQWSPAAAKHHHKKNHCKKSERKRGRHCFKGVCW